MASEAEEEDGKGPPAWRTREDERESERANLMKCAREAPSVEGMREGTSDQTDTLQTVFLYYPLSPHRHTLTHAQDNMDNFAGKRMDDNSTVAVALEVSLRSSEVSHG